MPNAMSDVSSRAVNAPESELKKNVEKIDYATGQSVLGTVLVARSRDGVCLILLALAALSAAYRGSIISGPVQLWLQSEHRALRRPRSGRPALAREPSPMLVLSRQHQEGPGRFNTRAFRP